MNLHIRWRDIRLGTFTATFVPFALMLVAANIYAEISAHLVFNRVTTTIWIAIVLVTPSFFLFIADRGRSANPYWLLTWTFSFLAYLLHFYFAFGVMHGGVISSVYAKQGSITASYNFLITIWWLLDVIFAWTVRENRWITTSRVVLHIALFIGLVVASVFLKDGVARLLGLLMALPILGYAGFVLYKEWKVTR